MPPPLPLSSTELEHLVKLHGTPLQLYSERGIRAALGTLTTAFANAGFPYFREFYAVKALPNPAVLAIVKTEGCGLDCSSAGELWVAGRLGFQGSDVMYTSNYTSDSDLTQAITQRVIINLDDASLVPALAKACVKIHTPFPELICFRLNPGTGNTSSETKSNLLGGPTAKFGIPLDQIRGAYVDAMARGAKRFGIHIMTGSCVIDVEYWGLAVGKLLETATSLQKDLGIKFEFVNIGGGIGIPYRPDQPAVDVDKVAKVVADEFIRWFGADKSKWPKLFMENGRYVTGPSGWLVARCNSVKSAFNTRFYGLDACMANLMRPGMYESYHHITVHNPAGEIRTTEETSLCNVVGTLCENNDWFCKARALPRSAQVGDLFVIHDTGAHSHSMGFQYNSKLRAPEVMIRDDGKTYSLIRRREVIEDLFANTMIPNDLAKMAHAPQNVVIPKQKERVVIMSLCAVVVLLGFTTTRLLLLH